MSEERDIKSRKNLEFMFKVISVSKIALDYWLSVPAFSSAMLDKMERHEPINNKSVLRVMEEIYKKDIEPAKNSPAAANYNYYLSRKAINQLRRAVNEVIT